jgi:hypothetical protein
LYKTEHKETQPKQQISQSPSLKKIEKTKGGPRSGFEKT